MQNQDAKTQGLTQDLIFKNFPKAKKTYERLEKYVNQLNSPSYVHTKYLKPLEVAKDLMEVSGAVS